MVTAGPVRAGLVLLLVVLAGCAGLPPAGDADDPRWRARAAALSRLDQWQASGRIGVTRDNEAWSGSLDWRQTGERYAVDIVGPFGQGRLAVEGDADGVVLRAADGREFGAADADALIERATGVSVPVLGLRDWVLGRPMPAQPARLVTDADGRLQSLEQAGWTVVYGAYEEGVALPLPTRLRATHGDVQVRLAIERWTR